MRSRASNGERAEAIRLGRERVFRSMWRKAYRRHRSVGGGIGLSREQPRKYLGLDRTVVSVKSVWWSHR